MKININDWHSFRLEDIFIIQNGKGITADEINNNPGSCIAVQGGEKNNGCVGEISLDYCKSKNYTYTDKPCLTLSRIGSAGFVSFHPQGCAVGNHASILLLPDDIATIERYLFLQTVLTALRTKFSYSRMITQEKRKTEIIDLPAKLTESGYLPDWEFMDKYINILQPMHLAPNKNSRKTLSKIDSWEYFKLTNLFFVQRGQIASLNNLDEGTTPIVSSSGVNEGIACYGDVPALYNNRITVAINGSTGFTAFHGYDFNLTTDCCVLLEKFKMNKYQGLFLATIIGLLRPKYNYGRKMTASRIENEMIMLPVKHNPDGTAYIDKNYTFSDNGKVPDWQFMEEYIKSLPFGDKL